MSLEPDIQNSPKVELDSIMEKMYVFLKQYNNNYRPIYHLESIFFYIITILQNKRAK